MQGSPAVVEVLNEILTAELTAINQYFIHGKMCQSWGFAALAEKLQAESIDEMRDADRIIDRILYLGGVPNMQRMNPVGVGETVLEMHQLDLELERAAIERYNRAIALVVAEFDHGSRELLERQLVGEEHHADWIESQLELIDQVGLENYLAQQMHS